MSLPLTPAQLDEFVENGCLHLRGLIPPALCQAAEDAIWAKIPQKRDKPEDWPDRHTLLMDCIPLPEVQAIYNASMVAVMDQLVGPGLHDQPVLYPATTIPIGPLIAWPQKVHTDWRPTGAHLDQHGPKHRAFVVGMIIYLHEVASHSGATVLWPGAFRTIEEVALQTRQLPCDIVEKRLGFEAPKEFYEAVGGIGDVLLFTRNGLHSGSLNHSTRPRVALQGMIHVNPQGEAYCRNGTTPRPPVARIYDRHFEAYHLHNYFGCRPK